MKRWCEYYRISKRSWKRINIELCRSRYEFDLNTFERIYIQCGSKVSAHFFVLSRVLKIHNNNSIQKISWIWNTIRKKNVWKTFSCAIGVCLYGFYIERRAKILSFACVEIFAKQTVMISEQSSTKFGRIKNLLNTSWLTVYRSSLW